MQSNRYTARAGDLVVQELGDELLIYDQRTDIAHCLTATAALVWRTCEGGASHDDLVRSVTAKEPDEDPEALVLGALDALDEKGLLANRVPEGSGISRRQAIHRMAGVGAAAFAAPFVVSAAVPSAEASHSPGHCTAIGGDCTTLACCTNLTCYQFICRTQCTLNGDVLPAAPACPASGPALGLDSRCCSGKCNPNNNKCRSS